jgi:hypothetical protein
MSSSVLPSFADSRSGALPLAVPAALLSIASAAQAKRRRCERSERANLFIEHFRTQYGLRPAQARFSVLVLKLNSGF